MNTHNQVCVLLGSSLILASCTIGNGWICGPQTPAAYCDREAYQKLMYPKAYGEYWEKEEAMGGSDAWRNDWVDCGGMTNGAYSSDAPNRSPLETILAEGAKKRKELGTCMSAKGYHWTGRVAPY